jgi:hypothetical protein
MSDDAERALSRLATLADDDDESSDIFADPRWDELLRGEASAETRAELERLADEAGVPEAMELFAPPTASFEQRIVASVEAVVAERSEGANEPSDEASAAPPAAKVIQLRPLLLSLAAVLAAAAMFALWWSPSGVPLPAYALTLDGGERVMRDDAEAPRLHPGGPIDAVLRPRQTKEEPVALRVFLVSPARAVALVGETEAAPSGTLRFHGNLPTTLPGEPLALWFFIGTPTALPAADADRATLVQSDVQRVEAPITVTSREGEP